MEKKGKIQGNLSKVWTLHNNVSTFNNREMGVVYVETVQSS